MQIGKQELFNSPYLAKIFLKIFLINQGFNFPGHLHGKPNLRSMAYDSTYIRKNIQLLLSKPRKNEL